MPTLVCTSCGYAGGTDYHVFEGFTYAEKVWNYWQLRATEGRLELQSETFNPDLEQTPADRKIECGGCGDLFSIPDGFALDWV